MILVRRGDFRFRWMNFNAAQPPDQPIGRFGIQMLVRNTERADDPDVLAILGATALEDDMVELVARDGKRVVATSVRRATRFPRVMPDPARSEPALP